MTSDPGIFWATKLLIDKHGAGAPMRAARRSDELQDAGDVQGAMIWRRILEKWRRGCPPN